MSLALTPASGCLLRGTRCSQSSLEPLQIFQAQAGIREQQLRSSAARRGRLMVHHSPAKPGLCTHLRPLWPPVPAWAEKPRPQGPTWCPAAQRSPTEKTCDHQPPGRAEGIGPRAGSGLHRPSAGQAAALAEPALCPLPQGTVSVTRSGFWGGEGRALPLEPASLLRRRTCRGPVRQKASTCESRRVSVPLLVQGDMGLVKGQWC